MAHQQPIRSKTQTGIREIPDKLYFRIGDVAKLCEVPAYVLRFWETEFPQLKPNKGGTGQRLYRRRDVEMALRVKTLLYDEGYTIAGARQALKSEQRSDPKIEQKTNAPQPVHAVELGSEKVGQKNPDKLNQLRNEMRDLLSLLSKPALAAPAAPTFLPIPSLPAPAIPAKPTGATVQSIRSVRARRPTPESGSGSLFADIEE
jgi:DNA-binding transcriptional MerR regulator